MGRFLIGPLNLNLAALGRDIKASRVLCHAAIAMVPMAYGRSSRRTSRSRLLNLIYIAELSSETKAQLIPRDPDDRSAFDLMSGKPRATVPSNS